MRFFRLSLLTTFITTTVFSHAALAAAFQLYELGTPIIGTAGVGQAAVAEDASTAYFNPAGMALLKTSNVMVGSQLLLSYANFSRNTSATTILGNNGGNAAGLTPGVDLYYAYSYSPNLKFGISLTSPYGGMLNYNDGWVGRFVVQGVTFYTLNLNPSIAYRINDKVSIGGGLSLEYMNLQETVALPIPITPLVDGQAKVNLDSWAPGFNLGVMFTPRESTKIGIAYRSKITHDLHGSTTFLRITSTPNTSSQMVMPQNIIMSLAQDIKQFTLLGEVGWANWATMRDTTLTVDGFSAVTPRDWNNTYRIGLGGQYKINPLFLVQAGASFDSSPTNSSHRLPDLPMDRQVRLGIGLMYTLIKQVTLGASYEYMNLGHANINNFSSNGALVGSYSRNYANTMQISLNVET